MSLTHLYTLETLRHQIATFPTAFRVVAYEAANTGDIDLADRALDVLDKDQLSRMSDYGFVYHDGKVERDLREEPLLRSLIRVLDGRDFGHSGIRYIEKLLDVAPAMADTYCLVHAITSEIAPAVLDRLIAHHSRPMELTHSSLKLQGHRLQMSPLAAAVIANKPSVFERLLAKLQREPVDAHPADLITAQHAVVQHDRNIDPTVHFLPNWIVTQSNPGTVGQYLQALFAVTKPSDNDIDRLILGHLLRLAAGRTIPRVESPRMGEPVTPSSRHNVVSELMRFRRTETPFPALVLHEAIMTACAPILESASTSQDGHLRAYLRAEPDPATTLGLIMQAPGAAQTDINLCLKIATSNGIDINVRSQQPGGKTALFLAAKSDALDTAQALLDLGADPEIKDNRGWKATSHFKDLAVRQRYESMVDALKAKAAIAKTAQAAIFKTRQPRG